MKISTLQYSYSFHSRFEEYEEKISQLVEREAKEGVDLLLFPEYAGFEISSFAPLEEWDHWLPRYLSLFQRLSEEQGLTICSGTQIAKTEEGRFVNRAYLFLPNGKVGFQDKCLLTPYEVEEGLLTPGDRLHLFETPLEKIGIAICYDAEFPRLVEPLIEGGAELLLVPSYTSSRAGSDRVVTSCKARALEGQCYVAQSPLVGKTDVEIAYGIASISGPIDEGFPEEGLIALGERDQPGVVRAMLDFSLLKKVRDKGQTHNYRDGQALKQRALPLKLLNLA